MDFSLGAQDPAVKHAAQIKAVADALEIDPESVLHEAWHADPTGERYIGWILKQMKFKNIVLPEDRGRVVEALTTLEEAKRVRPEGFQLDINRYRTIGELEEATDSFLEIVSGREMERPRKVEDIPQGAKIHAESENYRILEVTHPDTCIYLARGTKWCTREQPNADGYIERYGKLFVILARDRGEWVVYGQYTPDYLQVMDTKNNPMAIDNEELANLMGPDLDAPNSAALALLYAQNVIRGRWPLAEPVILQDPRVAYIYANQVIRGRWPEAEPLFARHLDEAYMYAKDVIKGPWPPGERVISENATASYNYAVQILHDRFPEGEPELARTPSYAYLYAIKVIRGRFPEAEPFLAQDPEWAVNYAKNVLHRRFPEAEPVIASSPKDAYEYMSHIIGGRWPMGEAAISRNPDLSVAYAKDVIGGPFPEGEEAIASDARRSYVYARDVLQSRFPAGEAAIAKEPEWTFFYARDVIRGRWLDGEEALYKNRWWTKEYEELFQQ